MRQKIFTVILLTAALFTAGCGIEAANESTGLPTEEQLAAAKDALGDDISELNFSVDGVVFQYPMIMQDMLEADWYIDNSVKNELKTLEANTRTTNFVLRKNKNSEYGITECSVTACNTGSSEKEIKDTELSSLSFSRDKRAVLILPQGLTWDSTFEEVCDAYQPEDDYVIDRDGILTITITNASYDGHLYMYFDPESRELSKVEFK